MSNIGKIVFDENTDYASVEIKLNTRLRELVAIHCSCNCNDDREDKIITQALKYKYVGANNLLVGDLIRYHDCVQAWYYELIKLDC